MHHAAFAVYVLTAALITTTGLAIVLALIQATGYLGTPAACASVPASVTKTFIHQPTDPVWKTGQHTSVRHDSRSGLSRRPTT